MAILDITEKILEDYNDVFADIANVLLFQGEQRILPEQLVNTKDKSMIKADGKIHEQERDVNKYWNDGNVTIALYGIENQTDIDKDMPLRVYSYDGASYKQQLLNGKDRYPVITMVLYFGTKRWNKPKTLSEIFHVPEELKPYFNDHKINLFEIAFLEEEQVQMFKSDFRIVADYFVQIRKNKNYIPSKDKFLHVEEVLKMMSVLTKDSWFEESYNQSKGGVTTMCEVIDKAMNEGRLEGRLEGRTEGRTEGMIEGKIVGAVITLNEEGYTVEEIAKRKNISKEEVERILKEN